MNFDMTMQGMLNQGILSQSDYDAIMSKMNERDAQLEKVKKQASQEVSRLTKQFKKWTMITWNPEVHFSLTTQSPVKVTEKVINFNIQQLHENSDVVLSANLPITLCKFISTSLLPSKTFTEISKALTDKDYNDLMLPIRVQIESFVVYRYQCPGSHIREVTAKRHRDIRSGANFYCRCGEFKFQERIEFTPDIIIDFDRSTKTYFAYWNDSKEQIDSSFEYADPHSIAKLIEEKYPNKSYFKKQS